MYNERTCELEHCEETFEPYPANKRFCKPEHKREAENARRRELVEDVVTAIETRGDVDVENEDDDNYLDFLRRENRRLANLAEKRKFQNHDAAEEIYRAAYDALSNIEMKPVKSPKPKAGRGEEEAANVISADWQLGKVSKSYNSEVCAERLEQYIDKVLSITDVQRSDHPVNRVHVDYLGDIIEGEDIFPGQLGTLDASLYKQMVNGVNIAVDMLRRLLSHFEYVHVAGVIGNHAELSGKRVGSYNPESNMDRLLYKFLEMMFQNDPRITFDVPEGDGERNFYAIDKISTPSGSLRQLLVHGDQFPKPTSLHQYHKKITGWASGAIKEPFDTVYMGHYHQVTKFNVGGGIPVKIAGSPESDNEFASEIIGAGSKPSQPLQFVRGDIGVTAEYEIDLR